MSVYLDASVLVALFTIDQFSDVAEGSFRKDTPVLIMSDFAAAEFASAVGRRVRMGELSLDHARAAFANLDVWGARSARRVGIVSADITARPDLLEAP